jgi:hypothetical protein
MADECSDFGLDGAVIMEGRRGLAGLAAGVLDRTGVIDGAAAPTTDLPQQAGG